MLGGFRRFHQTADLARGEGTMGRLVGYGGDNTTPYEESETS